MTPSVPKLDLFWWGDALKKTSVADWLNVAGSAGEVEITVGPDGLLPARRVLSENGWRVVSVRAHEKDEGFSMVAKRDEEEP